MKFKDSGFLGAVRALVLAIFPPKDLYRSIFSAVVHPDQQEFRVEGELRHLYSGEYEIGLRVPKSISMRQSTHLSDCRLRVGLTSSTGEVLSAVVGDSLDPWWSSKANGFALTSYWVPTDLPKDTWIKCTVTVEKASNDFVERYGGATLYIRKSSEKREHAASHVASAPPR